MIRWASLANAFRQADRDTQDSALDPSGAPAGAPRRRPLRETAIALAAFALILVATHGRVTDPDLLLVDDLGLEFLPKIAYAYEHPWQAFRTIPSPDNFGSAFFGSDTLVTQGSSVPFFPALLSLIAPASREKLPLFEWWVTGCFLLVALLSLYLFLRSVGVGALLAWAVAVAFALSGPIYHEWYQAPALRGRLLIPLVMWLFHRALTRGGYVAWLLAAGATVFCLSQSLVMSFVGVMLVIWAAIFLWSRRHAVRELLATRPLHVVRLAGPPVLAAGLAAWMLLPVQLGLSRLLAQSAFQQSLSTSPDAFFDYLYAYAGGIDSHAAWVAMETTHTPGPLLLAGLLLAFVAPLSRRLARRLSGQGPTMASQNPPPPARAPLAAVGWTLLVTGVIPCALATAPHHFLFQVRDGSVVFSFLPVKAPPIVAMLFHLPYRTWHVMALCGALLVIADLLSARNQSRLTARWALVALCIYVAGLFASAWLSGQRYGWAVYLLSCGMVGLAMCGLLLGRGGHRVWQRVGSLAIVLLSCASAVALHRWMVLRMQEQAFAERSRDVWAAHIAIAAKMPSSSVNQAGQRVGSNLSWVHLANAGFALNSSATTGKSARLFSAEAHAFFRATSSLAVDADPYRVVVDYERLHRLGLLELLGIRHWIIGEVRDGRPRDWRNTGSSFLTGAGRPLLTLPDGPLRYFELPTAFPRAWLLRETIVVASYADAVIRLLDLGNRGELRTAGVVVSPGEGWRADADSMARLIASGARAPARTKQATPPAAPGELKFSKLEAAEMQLEVAVTSPTVLATNEFFDPSWRIEVDGRPAPLLRVNAAFIGVRLEAGAHLVRFSRRNPILD